MFDLNNMSGSEIIFGGDINGCDSIIDVNISFDSEVTELIDDSHCEGEEIMINGVTFDMNNTTGSFDFQTATGCDSVVMVDLSFFAPTMSQATPTLCPEETLTIGNETFDILDPQEQFCFLEEILMAVIVL